MPKALQRGEAGTRCRRRYSGDRYHSGGFLLRAMPPSWHPVPACVRYGILQAKPFSLAATENRIGRGPRCRYDHCRRNHSLLPQRKLESDAEFCRGGDCRHSGGFLLRAMPPSWHPVPACVRYGILQAKPFSLAAAKNRIGRGTRCRNGCCRRAILHCSSEDAASIPKSGLEIKNRCTQEGINRQNLASIPKSEPEIKNRCMQQAIFSTRSLNESRWR